MDGPRHAESAGPAPERGPSFNLRFCPQAGAAREGRSCPSPIAATRTKAPAAGPWRRRLGPGFTDLKVVVAGEIDTEVPGHDIVLAQVHVDDYALDGANRSRHTPWRIGQVASRLGPAGAELAHDARETLCPVTGTERFSLSGHTQYEEFFGGA